MKTPTHRFCVAPMMDYTDRHCRFFFRLLSTRARLYTEMVTAAAVTHSNTPERFLDFNPSEHPVALQLGGSEPARLAAAARIGERWGYDEINLNIGCPSDRVTSGRFGACLMAEPRLVAECVKAMRDAVAIPVTVKMRIGIDDQDEERCLDEFVAVVSEAGCDTFIVHARKAWLQGLSPKENREIPPLNYPRVHALKRTFPGLTIILNGGLKDLAAARAALMATNGAPLDGVMLGRAVCETPYLLADVDAAFFATGTPPPSRGDVATAYLRYAEGAIGGAVRPHHVLRHLVRLFHGCPGARAWRQAVSATQTGPQIAALRRLAVCLDEGEPLAA